MSNYPSLSLCIPSGITAGASCSTAAAGIGATAIGSYMIASTNSSSSSSGGGKSSNQIQNEIVKEKAPKNVERLDKDVFDSSGKNIDPAHIYFKDGSALYKDGTWKHGGKYLNNKEIEWLKSIGWGLPK